MARKFPNSMEVSWEIYWKYEKSCTKSGFSRHGADDQRLSRLSASAQRIPTPHHRSPCDRDGQQVCAERSPVSRRVPYSSALEPHDTPCFTGQTLGILGGLCSISRQMPIVYCQLFRNILQVPALTNNNFCQLDPLYITARCFIIFRFQLSLFSVSSLFPRSHSKACPKHSKKKKTIGPKHHQHSSFSPCLPLLISTQTPPCFPGVMRSDQVVTHHHHPRVHPQLL